MDEGTISFGSFRLFPGQRLLLEGDKPIRLGSRAFEILSALVDRPGEVVAKDELIARAWPTTVVEESNLKLQISALRRALGDGGVGRYIVTVPGRGYSFVAAVSRDAERRGPPAPTAGVPRQHNLPFSVTRMIGREDTVAALLSRLARDRLVTILGPGGVGKTTVALAVAEKLVSTYEHGVWLIDLAPLAEPALVASTVATVLGLEIHAEDQPTVLAGSLHDKRMLLVLDNCEHVIDAAASLAEMLLRGAPGVSMLATSREPMGVESEREYRLGPLPMPSPSSPQLSAAGALAFPAVQLFVERVSAVIDDFALTDADAPLVVEICRRLDGLPLGIEFAAARVEVLGVRGIAANLNDNLDFFGRRRRQTTPRQGTIRAVLDWSYGLLREDEKQFFRRLGILAGNFSIEAASRVAMDSTDRAGDAVDLLADLVVKSLLTADVGGTEPRFRLLETTRVYALEKLRESGERDVVARRHAEYYRDVFAHAATEWDSCPMAEWLAGYAWRIDNLRAALDWAFSPSGDASIGVALTASSIPLWVDLSMLAECRRHAERALARLGSFPDSTLQQEMHLQAALGTSLSYTTGPIPETEAAWTRTLEIAKGLGDHEYQLRALRGLWAHRVNAGDYRAALDIAREFSALAATAGDPIELGVADRMMGTILHYLGDQTGSRRHLERHLDRPVAQVRHSQTVRFLIDDRVTVRSLLARMLWFQGFPDQAMRTARLAADDAEAEGHALSLCHALGHAACPVALYTGDLAEAERTVALLLSYARELGLRGWMARGRCFQGTVLFMRGDFAAGLPLLRAALRELREEGAAPGFPSFLTVLARGLGRAGQLPDGLAAIDQALTLSEHHEERWSLPEVLRNKGELLLLEGEVGAALTAEDCFRQALDWAGRDGTLSWELRAATSLARLWRDQGRSADAITVLQLVYDRFTEGFGTADLIEARRLLNELIDVDRE